MDVDFFHWRTTLPGGRVGGRQHQPTQVLVSLTKVFSTNAVGLVIWSSETLGCRLPWLACKQGWFPYHAYE